MKQNTLSETAFVLETDQVFESAFGNVFEVANDAEFGFAFRN